MFESFIQSYGYYAVFAFACIEGEIAVLTAGFLCKQGYMSLELVMLAAFLGTLITEQCLFFVGRIYGGKLLEKYPKFSKKSATVIEFLQKYDAAFIFGSRFIYGIRNVSPIIIGMAKITPLKFSSLNVPAALIWSIVVAGAGYFFANILESTKGSLEFIQIGALVVLGIALLYFFYKKTRGKK
ncbi:MAG: DedA family protein [Holosporaceae bacterium]|nr:DedA family protein [Holosporaceae bacterium]